MKFKHIIYSIIFICIFLVLALSITPIKKSLSYFKNSKPNIKTPSSSLIPPSRNLTNSSLNINKLDNRPLKQQEKVAIIGSTPLKEKEPILIYLSEEKIITKNGSYQPVKNHYAIPEKLFSRSSIRHAKLIGKGLDYVFIKVDDTSSLPKEARPVAWDNQFKRFVVVTGFIKLIPVSEEHLESLEDLYEIKLSRFFNHIMTAFYKSDEKDIFKLIEIVKKLKIDPRVKNTELVLLKDIVSVN